MHRRPASRVASSLRADESPRDPRTCKHDFAADGSIRAKRQSLQADGITAVSQVGAPRESRAARQGGMYPDFAACWDIGTAASTVAEAIHTTLHACRKWLGCAVMSFQFCTALPQTRGEAAPSPLSLTQTTYHAPRDHSAAAGTAAATTHPHPGLACLHHGAVTCMPGLHATAIQMRRPGHRGPLTPALHPWRQRLCKRRPSVEASKPSLLYQTEKYAMKLWGRCCAIAAGCAKQQRVRRLMHEPPPPLPLHMSLYACPAGWSWRLEAGDVVLNTAASRRWQGLSLTSPCVCMHAA